MSLKEVNGLKHENDEAKDVFLNGEDKLKAQLEAEDVVQTVKPKISYFTLLKGYLLIILFAFIVTINAILLKMAFIYSGSDAATVRYFLQFISMLIVIKCKNLNALGPQNERKLLCLRAFTGIFGLVSAVFAIKFINPSDFKAISHSKLILTAILARIVLKEKLTSIHLATFLLTIVGVLFISQPTFLFSKFKNEANYTTNFTATFNDTVKDAQNFSIIADSNLAFLVGIFLSLLSAFGASSSAVILKRLCIKEVHFSLVTIYAAYFGFPFCLILSIVLTASGVTHKNFVKNELEYLPLHTFYIVLASAFGIIGQVLMNLAYKYEDATKLSIVKTIDVFWAFILQYIFLNIKVNIFSVVGALTILFGAFVILVFKIIENKYKHYLSRKKKAHTSDETNQYSCDETCFKILFFKF